MERSGQWIEVGPVTAIDEEDVIRFDYADRTFAVYRSGDNQFYATDGIVRISGFTWPTAW